ncbi:MAG: hypothetical protein RJB31_1378 [Bacteroidota bacterium]|jgi:hypothetical protein
MLRLYGMILMVFIVSSCAKKTLSYTGEAAFKSKSGVPDYGKLEYWAAHPNKKDPSDTVPLPLVNDQKEQRADVFFLHPTTLMGLRENGNNNARIDDALLNFKTDYSPIIYQASAFNESARVFAPRYRQAHIGMYSEKDSAMKYAAFNLAYEDVKKAFEYYLQNENKGRPIIIASHSQGTTHATRLLKELFDGKALSNQLVCAYLLGMPVKKGSYEKIPICTDSTKTGCFVSWRTFREDYSDDWANRVDTTIVVVNPVTWKNTNEIADKSLQKGAVLYNLNKVYKNTQTSQVEGSALWVSHPKFPGSFLYRSKNYHAGDINLFYVDVRKDVSRRITYFLQGK